MISAALAVGSWLLRVGAWFLRHPWAIAAVALGVYCYLLRADAADLRVDLALSQAKVATLEGELAGANAAASVHASNAQAAEQANGAMAGTLRALQAQAAANLAIARSAQLRADRAAAALRIAADTIAHLAAGEARTREALYAEDASCAAMRVSPVCGALAARLRVAAQAHAPPAPVDPRDAPGPD